MKNVAFRTKDVAKVSIVALTVGALGAPALAENEPATRLQQHAQAQDQQSGQMDNQDATEERRQQQDQAADQQQDQAEGQQQGQRAEGQQQDQAQDQQRAAAEDDRQELLVVTVGQDPIYQSDVMAVMAAMPPQMRRMPPQMLVPMAVDQLILRSLILERARQENLQDDPEFAALVEDSAGEVEDQALVELWLQRNLADRVTETDVREAYQTIRTENPDLDQTYEELRPQIQTQLQRQAAAAIGTELREDVDIVFYGPEGEPIESEN